MPNPTDVRAALARIAETCPEDAKILREHLDSLLVHPLVLAERAIRATESAANEMGHIDGRVSKIEGSVCSVLAAEALKIEADASLVTIEAEERTSALARSKESGQWTRDGVANVLGWIGQRGEAAFALVIGAAAAWIASQLGGSPPPLP